MEKNNNNKPKICVDGITRSPDLDNQISLTLAQCFSTESGKEVLRYLRSITIELVNGANVSTDELRHIEGQRYIVGLIENRIQHAHKVKK